MTPSILIALPAYGNTLDADTAISLANLAHWLTANDIPFDLLKVDYGDIAEARNFVASFFLHKTPHSHLLFVDSDMIFKPSLVQKMLAAKADVVGAVAPLRREGPVVLNVVGLSGDTCERIGTGIMLISRQTFEKLALSVRSSAAHDFNRMGYDGLLHGFFDREFQGGRRIPEDFAFCDRWRATGGVIHAVEGGVGHVMRSTVRS